MLNSAELVSASRYGVKADECRSIFPDICAYKPRPEISQHCALRPTRLFLPYCMLPVAFSTPFDWLATYLFELS